MRILTIAVLSLVPACSKRISLPEVNAKAIEQPSISARMSVRTDSGENKATASVELLSEVYITSCVRYGPSVVFIQDGQKLSSTYIKERRSGYFFEGQFVKPHFGVSFSSGCDVDTCQPLQQSSLIVSGSLEFLTQEEARPVPLDYLAQLETIRVKLDPETYAQFAALKVLDAYRNVIFHGRYEFSVYGLYEDANCEKPLVAASYFDF